MTPGEHGEAVTSNRDTLAAAAHGHDPWPAGDEWACTAPGCEFVTDNYDHEVAFDRHLADALMPTVEAMLAQARAEVVAAVEAVLDDGACQYRIGSDPRDRALCLEGGTRPDRRCLACRVRAALAAVSGTDHDTTLDAVRAERP